jgi:uncharacterized protein (TIGR02246 family)
VTDDRAAVDRLIDEHFRAEETEDVDAIAATFTEDAQHDGDGTMVLFGREAIANFYRELYGVVTRHRFTTVRRLYGPGLVIDESDVSAIALGAPFGLPVQGGGRPFRFRLLHVFELRDGLISREQAWFDTKSIERQLPPTSGDR